MIGTDTNQSNLDLTPQSTTLLPTTPATYLVGFCLNIIDGNGLMIWGLDWHWLYQKNHAKSQHKENHQPPHPPLSSKTSKIGGFSVFMSQVY